LDVQLIFAGLTFYRRLRRFHRPGQALKRRAVNQPRRLVGQSPLFVPLLAVGQGSRRSMTVFTRGRGLGRGYVTAGAAVGVHGAVAVGTLDGHDLPFGFIT